MDLSGKGTYSPAHSFLQSASSIVSAYGLGSSLGSGLGSALVAGHTPHTTSLFSGTSHTLSSPGYSGSTSISPSHNAYSNGHNISSLRQGDKSSSDGPNKSQVYATPAPVFNRHKDSFPYGISGVPMPNYGYHSDVYQFTSNGYPRKSRTCTYCQKVFTRSTTRRYHERRCPLLRAAVSSYMGDETSGQQSAAAASSQQAPQAGQQRSRVGELNTQAFKGPAPGQSQSLAQGAISGIKQSDPQEIATSMLVKSPSADRRTSGDSLLSGYQTSVIVKKEPHEGEAMASMGATNTSIHKHSVQSQEKISESVLRFSPESENDSENNKLDSNLSPDYQPGIDLSRSPSHTSTREENTSVLGSSYYVDRYKLMQDEGGGGLDDGKVAQYRAPHTLSVLQEARYNIDLTNDDDDNMDDKELKDDLDQTSDEKEGDDNDNQDEGDIISDVESGEIVDEGGSTTSDKRDGKVVTSHKCGICGKCFESSGKLHLHEQLHTKFKPYACRFCSQKFAKSAQKIEHEKSHNGMETTHICAVCGSSFTRKYSLKLHMRRWHQEGPWLCRHCGKASLTQMELKTHLYSHNLPKMERESLLYMPDVPLNYNATSGGSSENSQLDGNGKEFADDNRPLGTANNSVPAVMDLPGGQEMEMCQECGRDFPKGYMRYHLKSHEAQKPYACPICAKRFGYKNNMKSHIKLHTGVKPFQCKMCGAKFTRGSTLRRHARRHGIIADSVWDLFIKPDYSKAGGNQQSRSSKLDTLSTSLTDTSVTDTNQTLRSSSGPIGNVGGDSNNYLASNLSPTPPNHSSLYPLYASLGQMPGGAVPGLYQGMTATTSFLSQHLPHSSVYAASSQQLQQHQQQLDALNLSLNKTDQQSSDLSNFSNASVERSRSRSRSLSGSESRRYSSGKLLFGKADAAVQVNTCCPPTPSKKSSMTPPDNDVRMGTILQKQFDGAMSLPVTPPMGTMGQTGTPSSQINPNSPSPMAVVPYIVTSPSQRPTNVDSTSPASVSSSKDYSLETISALIGSGRMFKCFHCECYFSEYAMYRIHAKLHSNDFTRPFLCLVCGEDCHDRVYFALHLSEHLR